MKWYRPQDPRANEPGDHPPMGERKGNWKVAVTSLGLVILAFIALWFWVI